MKKGTFIGLIALLVAAVAALIAIAAYFKNKTSYLYDEDDFLFDNPEDLDYYMAHENELYNDNIDQQDINDNIE